MKYGTILVIDDNPSILTALKICLGGTFEKILTLPRHSPRSAPTRASGHHLARHELFAGRKQRTGRFTLASHLAPSPCQHPRGAHHRLR